MEARYEVLLTIIDHGSFSKAAHALFMTQPAVSQYIKQIELEIGSPLFDRSTKKLQITGVGRIVEDYARRLQQLERELERSIHTYLEEIKGELRIGASYSFGEYILPNVLADFLHKHPDVVPKIDIHNTSDIAEAVVKGEIDIGIVEGKVDYPQIETIKLTEDQMVVVSNASSVHLHDLHDENWILRERGSGTREAMDAFLREERIEPKRIYEYGSTQLIKESVISGIGISFLSKWTIQRELKDGSIYIIDEQKYARKRDFYCIQRKNVSKSKAVEEFVNHLFQHVK